jgi:hypothetical protein
MNAAALIAICFMLISRLAYPSTLKMEEGRLIFQQTTRRYIPEDIILHSHRCKNLKSYPMQKMTQIPNYAFIFGNLCEEGM